MPGGTKGIFKTSLLGTSATASDLGTPGEIREDSKTGSKYRLVYLAAAATNGQVLNYHATSGTDGYTVIVNAQSVNKPAGVQNQAGSNLASGLYCWAQFKGMGSCSVVASYAANIVLAASNAGAVSAVNSNAAGRYSGHTISSVTTGVQMVRIDMD